MDREPDDLLDDRDLPDTWVRMARSTYNPPGEPPREEIWRGLEARLFPDTASVTRRRRAPWVPILAAASVVLLLGVGLGRWSAPLAVVNDPAAVPTAPATTARAPSTASVRFATARHLNDELHKLLDEHQIYRIDHYLAKETVQNLLVFRFANAIFEPLWNRNFIDHVQITAIETVDVGRRAGYYDSAGVLRDMFQNHLMQLLALVAMEPPTSFDADAVRNEKVKVLNSIRPIGPEELAEQTVRAQYDGYLDAEGVAEGSTTPTYTAIKLFIDNWRWNGVPFYVRSGKAVAAKTTEFIIQFKSPPHVMFPVRKDHEVRANYMAICIQPHEGIHLRIEAKVPDTQAEMRSVDMEFHYDDSFEDIVIPEAYELLLMEALQGDPTLFTRADGIEAAWTFVDAILKGFDSDAAPPMDRYEPGTWGPELAERMINRDGRAWIHGCAEHD